MNSGGDTIWPVISPTPTSPTHISPLRPGLSNCLLDISSRIFHRRLFKTEADISSLNLLFLLCFPFPLVDLINLVSQVTFFHFSLPHILYIQPTSKCYSLYLQSTSVLFSPSLALVQAVAFSSLDDYKNLFDSFPCFNSSSHWVHTHCSWKSI